VRLRDLRVSVIDKRHTTIVLMPLLRVFALAVLATFALFPVQQKAQSLTDRARALHRSVPLIDGHNDLPWAIREWAEAPHDVERYDLRARTPGHTDLARLAAGGLGGQFWSVYIPGDTATRRLGYAKVQLEQIDIARRTIARYPDVFTPATTAAEVRKAFAAGRIGSLLGMEGGRFEVALLPLETPQSHGREQVEFRVAGHAGSTPRPVAKVASGGELSRVSLAIQVVANQSRSAATLIFDEIDAGVGGATAETVGLKLRQLAARRQVLCVTHLAQVAAQGRRHYAISKEVRGGKTLTRIQLLDDSGRVGELARMLGGREITASTQAHAAEMLKRAKK